jgi:hypothetical protein
MKFLSGMLGALSLSACTMLSAPAPLFSPADQDAAFALAEGLWVARSPDCKVNPARSRPERDTCLDWARVDRLPDGAWRVSSVEKDDDDTMRILFAPAAPRTGEDRAPLYVAETVNEKNGEILYAAIVARGETGATGPVTRIAAAGVECHVAYGDWGDIDGVDVVREDEKVVRCIAKSKDGVREAARRTAVSALPTLMDHEFLFVRP